MSTSNLRTRSIVNALFIFHFIQFITDIGKGVSKYVIFWFINFWNEKSYKIKLSFLMRAWFIWKKSSQIVKFSLTRETDLKFDLNLEKVCPFLSENLFQTWTLWSGVIYMYSNFHMINLITCTWHRTTMFKIISQTG